MNKGINTGICEACGREVPKADLKAVDEQYKSETIARGTPGMVKNYYKTVYLCRRCRFMRKFSIGVGIIFGVLYLFLWTMLMSRYNLKGFLFVLWIFLNPLVVTILFILLFRVVTKCDTLVKTDFHSK